MIFCFLLSEKFDFLGLSRRINTLPVHFLAYPDGKNLCAVKEWPSILEDAK